MKKILFILSALLLCSFFSVQAQFSTNVSLPVCWTDSPQGDSTIYAARNLMVGNNGPTELFYFDASGALVTIPGEANLRPGTCMGSGTQYDYALTYRCDNGTPFITIAQIESNGMAVIDSIGAYDYGFNPYSATGPIYDGDCADNITATESIFAADETQTDFTIPAGALRVFLKNESPKDGGTMVDATVTINGVNYPLAPGLDIPPFEAIFDESNREYKRLGAISITTNGSTISYYVLR